MVHIALPAMDEPELPARLLDLNRQSLLPKTVCVCINQPQAYYTDGIPQHADICRTNQRVYEQIRQLKAECRFAFALEVIDRFSPQNAWNGKHFGVGWARKVAMDFVARQAGGDAGRDIIVCADADTRYPDNYLENIQKQFDAFPQAVGLANPYYHTPEQENLPEEQQIAILRYEVYMRAYALNMLLSGHPYAFTAVGSSMACRLDAYRKIGGISPFKSGEDFYFLQKLAKMGALIVHSDAVSHPSSRLSERVFFGTGPALRKGLENRWESYPIYPHGLFKKMQRAYEALPALFEKGEPSLELDFWQEAFGADWWVSLLQNSGGKKEQFIRACREKFDALRSLQFLKANYTQDDTEDWRNLCCLYLLLVMEGIKNNQVSKIDGLLGKIDELYGNPCVNSLADLNLQDWKALREYLFLCENQWRSRHSLLSIV